MSEAQKIFMGHLLLARPWPCPGTVMNKADKSCEKMGEQDTLGPQPSLMPCARKPGLPVLGSVLKLYGVTHPFSSVTTKANTTSPLLALGLPNPETPSFQVPQWRLLIRAAICNQSHSAVSPQIKGISPARREGNRSDPRSLMYCHPALGVHPLPGEAANS